IFAQNFCNEDFYPQPDSFSFPSFLKEILLYCPPTQRFFKMQKNFYFNKVVEILQRFSKIIFRLSMGVLADGLPLVLSLSLRLEYVSIFVKIDVCIFQSNFVTIEGILKNVF